MPTKTIYYVVWKGRQTGVFNTWETCQAQVRGFSGAKFKAFPTRETAEQAYQQPYGQYVGKPTSNHLWEFSTHPPITASIAVDAACSGNPGDLEWRGVHTATSKELFHKGPYKSGTNNIGEFLAIVHALALLKELNNTSPVYSDSDTALAWVCRKKCATRLKRESANNQLFELITRAESWLVENDYSNPLLKWDTQDWGEIPADFNRK